jgi:hypothetical protein
MLVIIDGRKFVAEYFPFFRMKRFHGYDEWGIRLLDGSVSDMTVLVFDQKNVVHELHENARWLINEFILEEDDALTPHAQHFKRCLMEVFHEQRS